jgi:hypothetical protein
VHGAKNGAAGCHMSGLQALLVLGGVLWLAAMAFPFL